jgi:hypothetical protein
MQWRCQTTLSSHEIQKLFIFNLMLAAMLGKDGCGLRANGAYRAGLVVLSHQAVRQSGES